MSKDRPVENIKDSNYTINYREEAEDTFNKYFAQGKSEVIFLNGKWGSGKTSFLNIVFHNKKGVKLKYIDLWRVTSNQKPSELIYKKVFPITYWIIKYFYMLLFILLSGLSVYFLKTENVQWSYPILLSGFLSGLNQIIGKVDYNNIFLTCLKYRSKNKLLVKKRVIVIDDFDRIENDKQIDLYKIFNLLNKRKIQFVFLGDYTKIIKSKSEYLQKIIERRIELPYAVSPPNIWNSYIEHLINKTNKMRSINVQKKETNNLLRLKNVLISENRVLREKKIFEKYINEILFENNRCDQVNLDQQLVIIYLYLFHTEKYNNLVSNIENILNLRPDFAFHLINKNSEGNKEKDYLEKSKHTFNELIGFETDNEITSEVSKLCWDVLLNFEKHLENATHVESAFNDFEFRFPHYLINYVTRNLTGYEIRNLLKRDVKLDDFIIKITEDKNSDIYNFLRKNQKELSKHEINKLFDLSTSIIHLGYDANSTSLSQIVRFSFTIYCQDLQNQNEDIISKFEKRCPKKLDLSQKLRIYYLYFGKNFLELRNDYLKDSEHLLNTEGLLNTMYPQLIIRLVFENLDAIDLKTLKIISSFNDSNYFDFIYLFSRYSVTREMAKINVKDKNIKKIIKKRVSELDDNYNSKIEII